MVVLTAGRLLLACSAAAAVEPPGWTSASRRRDQAALTGSSLPSAAWLALMTSGLALGERSGHRGLTPA